ncbi:DUF4365 domain-containing protein [Nocardia sp. NPDC059246]|uniref:DUF4365 domain-containing protein n=1 Tax=unclassified Nocardia TaxID=2637762 RepID=UPI0036C92929
MEDSPSTDDTGQMGEWGVGLLVIRELRWKYREQKGADYGIDAQVEVCEGRPDGRLFAVQVKAGRSWFSEQSTTPRGWMFRPRARHVKYWLSHTLPVLVVLYDVEQERAYWQHIAPENVARTSGGGYKVLIPQRNRLDHTAKDALLAVLHRHEQRRAAAHTGIEHTPAHPDRVADQAVSEQWNPSFTVARPRSARTSDAIVVLPGFAGSTLTDQDSGRVVWSLRPGSLFRSAAGSGALDLRVENPSEQVPLTAADPVALSIGGVWKVDPYTSLLRALRRAAPMPEAVLTFTYDWRLGSMHNAALLAQAAENHLAWWRTHPEAGPDAELLLIAHGYGGLVAQAFTGVLGGRDIVRTTYTLGTPYLGSMRVLQNLSGTAVKIPGHRDLVRALRTMPAVYEMLPTYACVESEASLRELTGADVESLGGNAELAAKAFAHNQRMRAANVGALTTIVGVGHPTLQFVRISDGVPRFLQHSRFDGDRRGRHRDGDSLVVAAAATRGDCNVLRLPQTNNALPTSPEVRDYLVHEMTW